MANLQCNLDRILEAEKARATLISQAKCRKHQAMKNVHIVADQELSNFKEKLSSDLQKRQLETTTSLQADQEQIMTKALGKRTNILEIPHERKLHAVNLLLKNVYCTP